MRNFMSGVDGRARGYIGSYAEMKFTPQGRPVTQVRIGCGGTKKQDTTWVTVEAWDEAANVLNDLGQQTGLALVAEGSFFVRTWEYAKGEKKGQKGYRLELKYLRHLEIEKNGKMVEIPIGGDGAK